MRGRLLTLANAAGVFGALLFLWQLVVWIFRVPPYMLPPPWAVGRAVWLRLPSLLDFRHQLVACSAATSTRISIAVS